MSPLARTSLSSLFALCLCLSVDAAPVVPKVVVPQGVILVKGATPGTSDSATPLPEQGRVSGGRYRNAYFGLSYPIPAGWSEQPAGPPPSEGGSYVLTQFAMVDRDGQRIRANVLVSAQDLFFSALPSASARELVASVRRGLAQRYEIEGGPEEVTIAGRTFFRLGYGAPGAGLHWRVLSTDTRCHALTFTFTGTDTTALDAAERSMSGLSLAAGAPACLTGYAQGDNVTDRIEPLLPMRHFNTIPVRVIVDRTGRVKHVHLLSAFPEQSQAIIEALRMWRFKPYRVDGKTVAVETGLVFGMPRTLSALESPK